jgi:hypothetical protein
LEHWLQPWVPLPPTLRKIKIKVYYDGKLKEWTVTYGSEQSQITNRSHMDQTTTTVLLDGQEWTEHLEIQEGDMIQFEHCLDITSNGTQLENKQTGHHGSDHFSGNNGDNCTNQDGNIRTGGSLTQKLDGLKQMTKKSAKPQERHRVARLIETSQDVLRVG